jgi:hypothetical protein
MALITTGPYIYRAIATNLKILSDSKIVHFYNQRAEDSENRIKELKNDFGGPIKWRILKVACPSMALPFLSTKGCHWLSLSTRISLRDWHIFALILNSMSFDLELDLNLNSNNNTQAPEQITTGSYIYRAIATNLEILSDSKIVHFYLF